MPTAFEDPDEPLRSLGTYPEQSHQSGNRKGALPIGSLVRPLLASWPILLIGIVLGPAIAAVIQSRAPATYMAEALVAPNRTITHVDFGAQIKTVDDNSATTSAGTMTPERRQALVDLIRSSDVESQVIKDLDGKVPADELRPGTLIQHVAGDIRARSEILSIRATAPSASDAAMIANAWANEYVTSVNQIYSGTSTDGSLTTLRDQAQQQLNAAETALSQSMQNSKLEALDGQIQSKQALLTLLQTPYQPQDASNQSTSTSPSASPTPSPRSDQRSAAGPSSDYRLAERRTLDDLAQTLRRIDVTRESVRALLAQSAANGSMSPSDAAALAIIKTQLVSISDGLPSQLQLQLPSTVNQDSTTDLQTLASSLDQARAQVANEFNTRKAAYEQNLSQQVSQLEADLRDIRAQREAARAERNQLTAARDLAQETYTALAKKAEEQRVANSAAGHEVELASQANFASPVPRQNILVLAAAGLVGLVLAAGVALFRWYVLGLSGRPERTWPLRALRASSRAPSR
jgi:uncharacterized protein involved in exopolysaccharide biosynthesis